MYELILFLLSVAPPIAFLVWIYFLDKKEKEPKGLIAGLFIAGLAIAYPVGIAEVILDIFNLFPLDSVAYTFIDTFLNVALCEELGKFLCLFLITWKSGHFTHRYDAVVYAVAVSIGFATIENIMYVFQWHAEDGSGLSVAIARMLLAIPGHLVFAICMGRFYGLMKEADSNGNKEMFNHYRLLTLIVPILVHGFYDFCLMVDDETFIWIFFIFVVIIDIIGFKITMSTSSKDKAIKDTETVEQAGDGKEIEFEQTIAVDQ